MRAELGDKQNWFDSDDLAMMYRATFAPAFYRTVHDVVHHEFRARQLGDALRANRRDLRALRPRHLRQLAAWVYNRAALPAAERRLRRLAAQDGGGPRLEEQPVET